MNAPVRLERPTTKLKSLLAAKRAAIFPGTPNALFARVIEDLGFEAVYVTGAGIANMSLGVPDIGLVTLTELAEHVARICDAVSVPVLADADTGFGNPVNMTRTVARAGASRRRRHPDRGSGVSRRSAATSKARTSSRSPRWCRRSRPRSTAGATVISRSSRAPTYAPFAASTKDSSGRTPLSRRARMRRLSRRR